MKNPLWVVPKGTVVCPFKQSDISPYYVFEAENRTTLVDWTFTADDVISKTDKSYYFIKLSKTNNDIAGFAVVKGRVHPL